MLASPREPRPVHESEPSAPHPDDDTAPGWRARRAAEPVEPVESGRRLGNYRLDSVLGEGGMGLVYAATDLRDGREVAIKRVRPHLATPTLMRRLAREFELMQRVDHAGIVRPLALETDDDGSPYLVLERVRGESFALAELDRPPRERIGWIARAARLAGVAHGCGVVHRDIKPSNLMIGTDGQVHLLDFGIAKPMADEAMTALTQTGERMLTPRYAAPEQFRGESVGATADVYALGTMLLDSVFGLDATAPAATALDARETRRLQAIIGCARHPDPARRYADGSALADDLDRWLAGRRPRAAAWWRPSRWPRIEVFPVLVAIAVMAGAAAWQWRTQQRATPIDAGLGIVVADLDGLPADAAASVRLALAADAEGDRPRAGALMHAADSGQPHRVPVLYLATWERGEGGNTQLTRLDALLRERRDAYFGLLRDWLKSEDESPLQTQRILRAALDLRPSAWKLRLALAHQSLLRGDDAGARRELAVIDAGQLDLKRATIVLGDRAMLGDGADVERLLPALRERDALAADVVAAAVGLASGRCDAVAPGIDAQVAAAADAHRPDLADKLSRIGLLCLGELRRWPELLDAARRAQREAIAGGSHRSVPELAILAAIAALRSGDPDEAQRLLDGADDVSMYAGLRLDLALTRRMLGLADTVLPTLLSVPEADANDPALPRLVQAFIAHGDGDIAAAKQALADARRDGIRESLFAMHAAWLGRQLGETDPPPERLPMLWYPPTSRWATRW